MKILLFIIISFIFTDVLSQGVWNNMADFGGSERILAVGFGIGTKGYIGTGVSAGGTIYTKDFWEWDQSANVWSQKADFGGTARMGAVGFSIGAKGYIATGYDAPNYKSDLWEYDPGNNSWTQKTSLPANLR